MSFEPHPEGYEPRLFATTGKNVYEILKNGCLLERPYLPNGLSFDWWYIKIEKWENFTFNRVPALAPPVVPQEVWDALAEAGVSAEQATGVAGGRTNGLIIDSSGHDAS